MMDEAAIMSEVMTAAGQGARSIAPGQLDIIQEAQSEVALRWKLKLSQHNLPCDHKAWAFICGKNYARRILSLGARNIELADAIADNLSNNLAEEATIIEMIDPPAIGWLHADEAITAIHKLITITIRTIDQEGDEIDRKILHYHFRNHWVFSRVAAEIGISPDVARKRWARVMWDVIEKVMAEIRADERMAKIFGSILDDANDFRTSVLGLLSIISSKGFAAIENTLGSMLP